MAATVHSSDSRPIRRINRFIGRRFIGDLVRLGDRVKGKG
jgi:hypothetical protein